MLAYLDKVVFKNSYDTEGKKKQKERRSKYTFTISIQRKRIKRILKRQGHISVILPPFSGSSVNPYAYITCQFCHGLVDVHGPRCVINGSTVVLYKTKVVFETTYCIKVADCET